MQPVQGLIANVRQTFGPVEVQTLYVTRRLRITIGGDDNGLRMFVVSVEDSREVLTREEIRAMGVVLKALSEAS